MFLSGHDHIINKKFWLSTGHLYGKITDPEGKPLPGLVITLFNTANSMDSGSMRTNNSGEYNFQALDGLYELLVTISTSFEATQPIVNVSSCTILILPTIVVTDITLSKILGLITSFNLQNTFFWSN